jgi:hypothetical protein
MYFSMYYVIATDMCNKLLDYMTCSCVDTTTFFTI